MADIDLTQYPNLVKYDFDGNEQRAKVFLDRYAKKGPDGEPVETRVDEMWARVARAIAGDSQDPALMPSPLADDFRHLLEDFKFVPGGRILAGAGTGTEVTFYNCYVIPVETKARRQVRHAMAETGEPIENFDTSDDTGNDSREAIIDTIGVMVDIMSRGGGVGINWSGLRPAGAHLKTINATSSGPIDWMHFASTAVGTVEQGGSRRGAAMFMLDDWHPDVLKFIDAKRDLSRITNANISVAVSDAFMDRLARDDTWTFGFPDTTDPHYDAEWDGDANAWLEKGHGWVFGQTIQARDLWRKLAEAAWDNGEPGVVFLDRYNKQSTAQGVERLISVNPCGEQGLGPYSVCNLGAMNLSAYARSDGENYSRFHLSEFYLDVQTAVRFLDRVIDKNHYFLPENERVQKDLRRIGLSVMGLADALVKLGMRYGSPEAVSFTEQVFRAMKHAAIHASIGLAKEFGPAPAWKPEMMERPYLQSFIESEGFAGLDEHGLRNLFLLTQAPTGTTSILAGVNSGIEPFFATGYQRTDRTGTHWVQPAALAELASRGGGLGLDAFDYVVTAADVTVEEHIAMQAAAQRHIDSSVSKTINAPNNHTVEDVERAYTLAYESGLKGLAYFRDGCGRAQVLSTATSEKKFGKFTEVEALENDLAQAADKVDELRAEVDRKEVVIRGLQDRIEMLLGEQMDAATPFERPDILAGRTHKVRAGQQTAYVTVNRDGDNEPREMFVSVGKSGTDLMAMGEAIGRLASIGLQKGLTLLDVEEQLDGVGNAGILNRSLPSSIAAAIRADIQAVRREQANRIHVQMETTEESIEGDLVDYTRTPKDFGFDPSKNPLWADLSNGIELPVETEADEWSDVVAAIPLDVTHDQKTGQPFGMDLCPACGSMSLQRTEGCKTCLACAYSAC